MDIARQSDFGVGPDVSDPSRWTKFDRSTKLAMSDATTILVSARIRDSSAAPARGAVRASCVNSIDRRICARTSTGSQRGRLAART